jgi:amino acid adenylation domain-containing protein
VREQRQTLARGAAQARVFYTHQPWCIPHLFATRSEYTPDALAILAPGRPPLSYGRLRRHVDDTVQTLHAIGLGRCDRVAVVLPNGPEMAVACLAVASGAICMPLNLAYTANEFDFYLGKLRIQALLVQADMPSPARAVAQAHGLQIIELQPRGEAEAGLFTLTGVSSPHFDVPVCAQPDDVAFVMHTSGTTSQPKSVPLTHANVCSSAAHARVALRLEEHDRYLNILPLFHVGGLISGLLTSLMAGASVVCAPDFEAPQFFDWLAEFRPTWYMGVSVIHQAILAHAPSYREIIAHYPLRFIRSPAAALSPKVSAALESTFNVPVLTSYGVTEAILVTCNPLPPQPRKPGSVGVAVGPDVAIMDAAGRLLPSGETGEVVIRGPNVMRGYENDPIANCEDFTHGWFRTGDQGFLDADGYLFITGRLKEIINRGGESIAPQEVDNVFLEHPGVAQAVTFGVPHGRWGEDVMTAVVLHQNTSATAQELRRFAAMRLAPFKVPSQVIFVEAIPLGPTGKPQRHRLAEQFGLAGPAQGRSVPYSAAAIRRTPLEEILAGLWATVLGLAHVGINDNFFQLGGDSLLATQLLTRIREVTHIEVSFRCFFETPTVVDIARHITITHEASPRLAEPPLRSVSRDGPIPLSYAQQRLWFLAQLEHSRHAYHLLEAIRLCGPLQVEALEQGFQAIIRRHEVLHTTFTNIAGQPFQVVGTATPFPVSVVDLRALGQHERETQARMLAQAEVQRPFDLTRGPLLRAALVRLADDEYVLLLAMHHIISDGWSHGVFWREMTLLYEAYTTGQPTPLPALSIQYADFAHWQQQWLRGEVLETQLAYWKQQLAGISTLQLPTDHPRPAVQTFRGARHFMNLSPTLTHTLKALSRRYGVTLFMTLLAAFQTLLHRYTGQDDLVVGSLIANRNRVELEGLIGFFVNTLVLRIDLSGDPNFQELLTRVRTVTLGAYEHQDMPYEKLLEELRPPRDLSRNPLFQILFVLHNTPPQTLELPGLTMRPVEIDPGTARFDVTLEFWETPDGLHGLFEYSTDLFEKATIARMAEHLQAILEGIVADPEQRLSRLPLLTADEHHRLLVAWNTTTVSYPDDQCIHTMFETQVTRTPDAIAVTCGDAYLTYSDLNRYANQVAHYLRALGVGPEVLVGLCIERSLAMMVGLLGILKAGAAYVPLDPTYPSERLAFMLEDAKPPVVLTQERLVTELPAYGAQMVCVDAHWPTIAQYSDANPVSETTADNVAYLLYTSGSTGRPKGVLGVHRATLNALAWMWQAYPFAEHEVCCQKTSLSFGDSIQELLGPLLRGIRTILIPDVVLKDLLHFVQTLAFHRVTRLILVPSLLRTLLDTFDDLQEQLPSLQLWFAGGEALSSDLWQHFQERLPHCRLVNLYGASEASDDTTWYDTSLAPHTLTCVPIGRPIANTQVYVLDQHLQPVPIGLPGELYVGGTGLTRGYLNCPELTAERFLPHPFSHVPGARLYKTGDVVRYRPDSHLEYLGRVDNQVKLRGIRIELGEIEVALAQHPTVRETVVIVYEDIPGEPCLVAYVVPAQEPGPTSRELRRFLARQLPAAIVPAHLVMLETLPHTPSGKVDRRALIVSYPIRPVIADLYVAPRTPIEQQVVAIWCHLLGLEQVGIHDNFFELGGHSLVAMRLLSRVRDVTQVEVSLLSFFEVPTVAGMTAIIEAADRTDLGLPASAIVPVPREGALLASIAQEHFWLFDQLLPGLPLFNIPYVVRMQGTLNVAVLEQSFNEMIRRHEVLRTTFATIDGQLVQIVAPPWPMTLTVHDLQAFPEVERASEAQRLLQEESQCSFSLTQGPLLRGCILHLEEQEHLLLVLLHHIISDGWSLGVLIHELAILYDAFAAGTPSPLPELPIQYADFAAWQRQWRHNAMMQAQLAYWKERLHDPLPVLELPTDRPRGTSLHLRTARQRMELPRVLVEALKDLSYQDGSTLFMTCLAAFKILLYGYTRQADLRVATLVANRTRQEMEALIGFVVNALIIRTDLHGNPTCREVIQRVRATTLAAYTQQDLPFEELVRTLERECNLQRASLCQVMVIWQNFMLRPLQDSAPTLTFQVLEQSAGIPDGGLTTFDLTLILRERPQGLTATCIYKTDLFDTPTIRQMLDDFQSVLTCLSAKPEQALVTCLAVALQEVRR